MGGGGKSHWNRKRKQRGGKGNGKDEGKGAVQGADTENLQDEAREERPAKQTKFARNDFWQENGEWELSNEAYEAYYQRQAVCPPEEWPKMMESLRAGLPVAIRVNRTLFGAGSIRERLQEMHRLYSGVESLAHFAPQPMTWYADECAWQWPSLERRTIKKGKGNMRLKEYLFDWEKSGLITRQEAVSMIPPLFLDVQSHHLVIDMCAAPGSKTSQILEFMHWPKAGDETKFPKGLVLGNDVSWKRTNMLAHQVARLGSPCAAVVNVDAQFFQKLWINEGAADALVPWRFDRVLCDVPCTGDGTMRKTPFIWKSWLVSDGMCLHPQQTNILNRGLEMLKVGGRLVYSTCSLNPLEDEAVIATTLQKHGGAIVLVSPPDLPGLRAAHGVDKWIVKDPITGAIWNKYEEAPRDQRSGKNRVMESMFMPTGEGAAEILASVKQHCRRFLPHLMDTGGFFVAILEKRGEMRPSLRSQRRGEYTERARVRAEAEAEAKARAEESKTGPGNGENYQIGEAEQEEETIPNDDVVMSGGTSIPASSSTAPHEGLRNFSNDYSIISDEAWNEIRDYYGFHESTRKLFVKRGHKDQKISLVSEGLQKLMRSSVKASTRLVLCGVQVMDVTGTQRVDGCAWTLMQQGSLALVRLGLKRHLRCSKDLLMRLLKEKEIAWKDIEGLVAAGSVRGLDDLRAHGGGAVRPGCLILELDDPSANGSEFALVADATEDTLELQAGKARDIAALLSTLTGQPSVEHIFGNLTDVADDENNEKAAEDLATKENTVPEES